jgi:hypothetical protein
MNAALAALYGTAGIDKTAADDTIDLTQMTAADFVAKLESGEIVLNDESEKTAGEDIDLSKLSARELLELAEAAESDASIEKMAADGSLERYDLAGRVMAHAFTDEMNKVAGDDDAISIDDLSAEELVAALDSGEFELVDLEKTAAKGGSAVLKAIKGYASRAGSAAKAGGKRYAELLGGKSTRSDVKWLAKKHYGGDTVMNRLRSYKHILTSKGGKGTAASEARKSLAARLGTGAAAAGAAGGAAYGLRKKDKK